MKKFGQMILTIALPLLLLTACGSEKTMGILTDLTVNYRTEPLGIEDAPVFSWKMSDDTQGQYQKAYRIVVADSQEALDEEQYVWDTGKVESDSSVAIPYEGETLEAETRYYWRVYAWDKDEELLSSEAAYFEMGITDGDWEDAQWIYLERAQEQLAETQDYVISYDVELTDSYTGFLWGADTNCYGEYYRWALDTRGEQAQLVISHMEYETEWDTVTVPLEGITDGTHHVEITVTNGVADTYIDGKLVDIGRDGFNKNVGFIGVWVTRGTYYATYDNILVTQADGQTLYEEDFEAEDNIFAPFYTKITQGTLKAVSGILMVAGGEEPAPMFRKTFSTHGDVVSARLYVSALGIYQCYINGEKIGDDYQAPGQSYYSEEVYYRTYDVTDCVQQGDNVVGAILGHGKYDRAKNDWGDELALCAKLVLTYEDGTEESIVTDNTWSAYGDGPIRRDDMFWGEYYDATYEQDGWNETDYSEDGWQMATVYTEETGTKIAAEVEPVRCVMELTPVSVTEPMDGVYVYDFGQNFSGICRIKVSGQTGQVITLRYAEALNTEEMTCRDDEIGTVWTQNLYTAENTDYYVCGGNGEETFAPDMVCRGFRYVQITGLDEPIAIEDIQGLVLTTDNEQTGSFSCSDDMINALYSSIYWTQLSNYVGTPTDCPQRDERLAWTGDAQVFAPTAACNSNIYNFMEEYLDALRLGQLADGAYSDIGLQEDGSGGNNGYGDAGITITWELYQQYGNTAVIRENFDAMCQYMDYLVDTSDGYLRDKDGYSDHNAVSYSEDVVCNSAQCAHAALLLSKMAAVIGEDAAAEQYAAAFEHYRETWAENYINEDGSIGVWLQSEYTMGLAFDLYPEELREAGAQKLQSAVESNGNHLNTGYITTPYLLPVLTEFGYSDTAYKLLLQNTYPSWGYMLQHGATTLTEAWNTYSDNGDGTYQINGSLNHYALGSVGEWLYSGVLGIKRDEETPAYKHFYLEPCIDTSGTITSVSGSYESMYGTITSEWSISEDGGITYHFHIPANTTATVTLMDEQYQNLELGAGDYTFVCEQ